MIPVLHPFQDDLVNRVRVARGQGKRIIVIQGATGCGKNTVSAYITKCAVDMEKYVLSLVHRRRLVDQISDRLEQFQVGHSILMRGEPVEKGFRCTVASRDTLVSRCVNNGWVGMPPANLVIVDEAHHAAKADSEYRRVLEQYREATILLLSATPVGPDGNGLGPWAQAIECAAPTSQLVREGYLMPVKCFAPDRKKKGRRYLRGIMGDLVESWKTYGEERPTVLFSARVQHSIDAVEAFRAAGISAEHMDADTADDERDRIFDEVAAGRIKILSNVGIVGEGVDVPELGCCQLYCEVGSRVRFLQACGRIMRPAPGKTHGILIDHSGACFRHGFPDEDTEWTLEGNVDDAFQKRHDDGLTEKALYCKRCELVYHGSTACPQCGREPVKPPRSIFAAPPVESTNEMLTEVDRNGDREAADRREREKTWFACLGVAVARKSTFGMAGAMYRKKYNEWPSDDFPCMPPRGGWKRKVTDVYPKYGKREEAPTHE